MKRNLKSTFARLGLARLASGHLIALTLIFLSLPSLLQAQTLEHRYSFVSDASDSVGGPAWDGTIVPPTAGSPATINNGLSLPGGGGGGFSGYVSLPDGIVLGDTSVTVECWLTQNQAATWAEPWDFGSSGAINFALIPYPNNNGNNMSVAFTPNGGEIDLTTVSAFPSGIEQYVVVTYDNSILTADIYTNGVLDATKTFPSATYSPGSFGGAGGTTENALGNDVYGDPQFIGTIYELRVWNGAVSQRYIAASALIGSGVLVTNLTPTSISVTGPGSVVITGTGQATLTVQIPPTGTTNLPATGDATNWTSGNTNILTVNSSGLVSGVGVGTTTVSATVAGVTGTSGSITVTPQTLVNRYSFVSDASDSVSGADGTLVAPTTGTAATINNGLSLPGNTVGGFGYSGYVSLPTGLLLGTSSLTVECWVTQNQPNTWAELWDFGNNGNQNFAVIPYPANNDGNMEVAFNPNNDDIYVSSDAAFPTNAEQYVVVTYNNSTLIGDLYTNGVLIASQAYPDTSYSPGSIGGAGGTTENMLGNDVYGDYQFDGTIYEFRIWNGAVSPLYIAVSAAAGSSVVVTNLTPLSVAVNVASTSMVGAQTQQATVVGDFAQASGVTVTGAATNWTSSNPSILSVSSGGLITGLSGGSATVSATVGGVTASSASITVALTAPVIPQEPVAVTAVVDQSATFTVGALGGDLSYQWSEGGTLIVGATDATLTLTNLALGQSGNYSVEVYNSLGTNYSIPVALTVDVSLLAHRYSFVSDASDSVGGPAWNGTIVPPNGGGAATISGGLNLPGNAGGGFGISGYVTLPTGIVAGDNSVTVECWVTQNQGNGWAQIWDFGIDNQSYNFALIPDPDNNNGNMEVANFDNDNNDYIESDYAFPSGSEQYVVVTYDNATLTGNLYTNGVLDAMTTYPSTAYSPGGYGGAAGTVNNYLGNDIYGDPQFSGTIYELRIWDGVVSQRYIAASAVLGPGVVVTNLTPTSASLTAGPNVLVTGTEQATVTAQLAATGANELVVTGDATNWTSGNTNVLLVNSNGLITGVSVGTTTVSATIGGITATSGDITVAPFALVNRYSFVSDASDSVSGADGTLVGPNVGAAATINNGLFLPGNTSGGFGYSGYVSLPAGLLLGTTSLTIECWVTQNQGNGWAEIWDFGNNGTENFGLIPDPENNNGNMEVAFTPPEGEVDLQSDTAFPNGAEQYVVVTYNNYTLAGKLYTNGVLDATRTYPNVNYAPGNIGGPGGTTENMLGNDVYGDFQFDGTIFEFRIWNGAVSPLYIAVSGAAGSSVVVTNVTPLSVAVTVATSMVDGQTQQATVTGNFAVASAVTVTGAATNWTSSATNVLTVSSGGLITAVGTGSATVSATVGGVSATSAAITVVPLTLEIAPSGTNVELTWSAGALLQAPTLLGPWTTNSAAVSPYTTPATNEAEFYKVKVNP
jgi:uncharacterized protein YjdB